MNEDNSNKTPKKPLFSTPPKKMGTAWGRLKKAGKVSAVIIDDEGKPLLSPTQKLNAAAEEHVDGHSPYKETGTPGSTEKSAPLSIRTTSGEKLERVGVYGSVAVYARVSDFKRDASGANTEALLKKLLDDDNTEFAEESDEDKHQVFDSDTAPLAHKKKSRSQKKVMGNISATTIVEEIFNIDNIKIAVESMSISDDEKSRLIEQFVNFIAEWLHLMDYAKVGERGQIPGNLTFGSKQANSQMMVVESYTSAEIKKGKHVKIEVKAHKSKHDIARKIEMLVTTDESQSPTKIIFNPFTQSVTVTQARTYFEISEKNKSSFKK